VADGKTLEPKHLAARMGLSPKRLRAILRSEKPRTLEEKGHRWAIPTSMAKEVEKAYKAKKAGKEAAKKAQIQKELKGEEEEEDEEEEEESESTKSEVEALEELEAKE